MSKKNRTTFSSIPSGQDVKVVLSSPAVLLLYAVLGAGGYWHASLSISLLS